MKTDHDIAEDLLAAALSAGADAADVIVVGDQSLGIGVSGGALEEAERSEAREAGLRVLIGQKQACVSASEMTAEALAQMAERAVALAREAPEDQWCGLADAAEIATRIDATALDMVDPAAPPTPEALEGMARAAEDAAMAVTGVTQVEQSGASWGKTEITLAASNGFRGSYARTSTGLGISAIAGEGLRRERDYSSETRRHRADLPTPQETGQEAGERAVAALDPRKPDGGAVPVLFDERVAASLIGHLLGAANGGSVARGSSWLSDAMGTKVLPDGFDISEDPLIVRGPASRPFDAEGLAARAQAVVEDGTLIRWILDCASARQLGLTSTGNARRGTSSPPSPGVSNIRTSLGAATRADLIRDMGTGLLVTSMIGSSINPTTGDYSRGASGFWIEGGEITYPVNEITIAGVLPEFLKTIIPANDADPHRAMSVPSLLVEGLTIGA